MKIALTIIQKIRLKNAANLLGHESRRNASIWPHGNNAKCTVAFASCHTKRVHTKREGEDTTDRQGLPTLLSLIGGCSLAYYLLSHYNSNLQPSAASLDKKDAAGSEIPGLPVYSSEEVSAHDSQDKGVWVSYKSGVYDITGFIAKHPGGEVILMAAGGSLEPFWEIYATHKTDQVFKVMEEYRIGNLSVADRGTSTNNTSDPYANDPKRHAALKPASLKPYNAEPPLGLLVESFITPNALFYVRNHLPVPEVKEYELEISGYGLKDTTFSLQDLKTKFPQMTVVATVQCAGNRRSELNRVKEVKGLNWGAAAIGTAEWSGVRLLDVLKYAKANLNDPRIKHVQFEGLDTDPANVPYGASVPADKALDPKSDVILAYEMNGQEIPRDHGYPVRVIVPGIVGARNVKWLGRIVLSDEESNSHWQRNDYKGFSPNVEWDKIDYSTAPAIQELPVTSVICDPSSGAVPKVKDRKIKSRGYAWSGGGRKIVRVDVSADGGQTWTTANLKQEDTPLSRTWSWTLWEVEIPVPKGARRGQDVELICKAVDSSYNVQPDTSAPIWNARGVLSNAWHRVQVKIP